MITRLEKEAAEEADTKAFCDKETSESKAKQAELTAKSDKSQVRIEKATATIAELKEQIKALQEQMAEMDAAQAEATSLRNKEHEEYSWLFIRPRGGGGMQAKFWKVRSRLERR